MKRILLLLAVLFVAGCGKNDDAPTGEQISLPDNTEMEQTAYADEGTTGNFTFTAKQSWTAAVTENNATRADNVEWVRLLLDGNETYSGGAGEFTLDIELDENLTGYDRRAIIIITSGVDDIAINVTQYGETVEEGAARYWQVTWELNGGTWPANDNHAMRVEKTGTLAEPAAPTRGGATFAGWYKEAELITEIDFPYNVNDLTANFTLYAKWTGGTALYVLDEGELVQTIYADETEASVTFTATEAWTATAKDITNALGEASWIDLSMSNGGPGRHDLIITADPNDTGADRKARITIGTISSSVNIELTQSADDKPGDGTRIVTRIIGEELDDNGNVIFSTVFEYFYDESDRPIRIAQDENDWYVFNYHPSAPQITFVEDGVSASLNMTDGRVTQCISIDEDYNQTISYDSEGRLKSLSNGYIQNEHVFTWTSGNLTKSTHTMDWYDYDNAMYHYYDAVVTTFDYWDTPNNPNCNLDLNGMALFDVIDVIEPIFGFEMGLYGSRCAQLIKSFNLVQDYEDEDGRERILTRTSYFEYDINPNGFITKITETASWAGNDGNGSATYVSHIEYR